jgi:hypothetical protein
VTGVLFVLGTAVVLVIIAVIGGIPGAGERSEALIGLVLGGATALPIASIVAFVLGAGVGATLALLDIAVLLAGQFVLRRVGEDPGPPGATRDC